MISDRTIPVSSTFEGKFVIILSITVLDLLCDLVGFVIIGVMFDDKFVFRNCSDLVFFALMSMLKSPQIKQSVAPIVSRTT